MNEVVITPTRPDDLKVGTLVDDDGARFVVLGFAGPDEQPISVTMTLPLFEAYVGHVGKVLNAVRDPAHSVGHK
ncbi:hypothetical protein ACLN6N_06070 [Sphingomonas carotinifaciens]|uniref:hypothetical protein n=1 Tax=Sphingomonas carotinifaciens TaxID=1166323 RepID=UPI0039A36559